jgi:hypothetical protein
MTPDRNAGVKRFLADLTIVTRADMDAAAAMARPVDLTDYYPPNPRWPADPDVARGPLAFDCADLDRGRVS